MYTDTHHKQEPWTKLSHQLCKLYDKLPERHYERIHTQVNKSE